MKKKQFSTPEAISEIFYIKNPKYKLIPTMCIIFLLIFILFIKSIYLFLILNFFLIFICMIAGYNEAKNRTICHTYRKTKIYIYCSILVILFLLYLAALATTAGNPAMPTNSKLSVIWIAWVGSHSLISLIWIYFAKSIVNAGESSEYNNI